MKAGNIVKVSFSINEFSHLVANNYYNTRITHGDKALVLGDSSKYGDCLYCYFFKVRERRLFLKKYLIPLI